MTPLTPNGLHEFDLEVLIDRFEGAWKSDSLPRIEEYIEAASAEGLEPSSRRTALVELTIIDLWHRWRRAQKLAASSDAPATLDAEFPSHRLALRPKVEDYLEQYPELGPLDEIPLILVAEEYRVRRRWGDRPDRDEYRRRFPRLGGLDEALAEIDAEAVRSTRVDELSTGAATPAGASPVAEAEPDHIGRYRIVAKLDEGGQGVVYRAVHPALSKELVIKVAREKLGAHPSSRERLAIEGKLLAELDHPNIARVYDLDTHEDRPFLVMEYIRGVALSQYMKQAQPEAERIAALLAQIARALGFAHRRGVIHLDLKPKNILIDEAGTTRVIDFGMARLSGGWSEDHGRPGSICGTLQFMAPEQARGENESVDHRSDIFALGAVLYWMLCGQAPFGGASVDECLQRARECRFDVAALQQSAPRPLAQICLKALARNPAARYPNAEAMAAALEHFATRRRRRLWWGAAAAAALLIVGLAVATLGRASRPAADTAVAATAIPSAVRRDFGAGVEIIGGVPGRDGKVTLAAGQTVAMKLHVDRDSFVGVWYVDHTGQATRLFPSPYDPENFVEANRPRTIPGDLKYAVRVTPSKGPEHVYMLASSRRWSLEDAAGAKPSADLGWLAWRDRVRGLALESGDTPAVTEVIVPIEVAGGPHR